MPGKNGLNVVTPTSIVVAGTGSSGTINANGSVSFTACTTLSLNGVFTSTYDNYLVSASLKGSAQGFLRMLYRAAGTDNTSATYNHQNYQTFTATSPTGSRVTSSAHATNIGSLLQSGFSQYIFGPKLTQPTVFRSDTVSGHNNGMFFKSAGINSLSTSWDGFTYTSTYVAITGSLTVYGFTK